MWSLKTVNPKRYLNRKCDCSFMWRLEVKLFFLYTVYILFVRFWSVTLSEVVTTVNPVWEASAGSSARSSWEMTGVNSLIWLAQLEMGFDWVKFWQQQSSSSLCENPQGMLNYKSQKERVAIQLYTNHAELSGNSNSIILLKESFQFLA